MAEWSEASTKELEHVLRREASQGVEWLALNVFDQHRRGGLADDAACACEPDRFHDARVRDPHFDLHAVAADRIVDPMAESGVGQQAAMIRFISVPQDDVFVQLSLVEGHAGLTLVA